VRSSSKPVQPISYLGRQPTWLPATVAPVVDFCHNLANFSQTKKDVLICCLTNIKSSRKPVAAESWSRIATGRKSETSSLKGGTSELAALACLPKQKISTPDSSQIWQANFVPIQPSNQVWDILIVKGGLLQESLTISYCHVPKHWAGLLYDRS
jgi:hypothetical protein